MQNKIYQQEKVSGDKSSMEKVKAWRKRKISNMNLANIYEEINAQKAKRLQECGNYLVFEKLKDEKMKLHEIYSCRVRLCPICSWRKSLKVQNNARKIVDTMLLNKEYRYMMLTLTVKNCVGEDLKNTVDEMIKAWNRLMSNRNVKEVVKGYYRGLEITHDIEEQITDKMYNNPKRKKYYDSNSLNVGSDNPNYNKYHAHFHCIFAVNKSYFTDKSYIKHDKWQELWTKAMRIDYTPNVNIKKLKGNTARDVAEVAKYTVKEADYIVSDKREISVETVKVLDKVLHRRRLIAYGGKMKEIHNQLNLNNASREDFAVLDKESENNNLYMFVWNIGHTQYVRG